MQNDFAKAAVTFANKQLIFLVPTLILLVLMGLVFAFVRFQSRSAMNGGPEDPAILSVEKLGGKCYRALDKFGDGAPDYRKEVEGNPVIEVNFSDLGTLIRSLPHTSDNEQNATRQRYRANVTDSALANFHLLKEVRSLSLRDTAVTDEGLKSIRHLRRLNQLDLLQTRVTDAGLKELSLLEELWDLSLSSTAVTDAGMKEVAKLRSLTQLNLNWTNVGDLGLAELVHLPKLHRLQLRDTHVTDAGIDHLPRCAATLSSLDIGSTAVTDKSLQQLAKLRRLRYLSLPSSKVTLGAAKELKKALPECAIYLNAKSVE